MDLENRRRAYHIANLGGNHKQKRFVGRGIAPGAVNP
jgi:hypothetical protein